MKGRWKTIRQIALAVSLPAVIYGCGGSSGSDGSYSAPWTRQIGSVSDDYADGITIDSTDNIYVAGTLYASFDGISPSGFSDALVLKFSNTGMMVWKRKWGTVGTDYGKAIAINSSDQLLIGGITNSAIVGGTNQGGFDNILFSMDSNGGTLGAGVQWGTASDEYVRANAVDSGGNIYVTGYTYGAYSGYVNAGFEDVFITKFNSTGVEQWTVQRGTGGTEDVRGIDIDSTGNIYITGETTGGLDGNINAGGNDIYLSKFNSSGVLQWTKQLGTAADESAKAVVVDNADNIYITGWTTGDFDGHTNSGGGGDIFLVKFNAAGTKLWSRLLGTTLTDIGAALATDSFDNVYIGGFTNGGLHGNSNAGAEDVVLIKYNSSGERQWTRQMGSAMDDNVRGLAADSNDNLYILGITNGSLDGNSNVGGSDIFIAKYTASGSKY